VSVIRSLWVALVGGLGTGVLAAQIVIANWLGRTKTLAHICPRNPTWSARLFLWSAGVDVVVEGAERLHAQGARVLVANHESWFDVLALCSVLPSGYRFAIKKELEKIPIWGAAWLACGHISVDRHNRQAAIQSLERARRLSGENAEIVIVFFPEGTRTETGAMLPFKKGAFVLALQLGVPIIPVAVIGGRQILPKHSFRVRRGTMRVVVGEPIAVEGMTFEDRDDLLDRSRQAIADMRGGEGPTTAPAGR
jgi:1-acyl-sn-glycerol-3-phosphate acyltransferase